MMISTTLSIGTVLRRSGVNQVLKYSFLMVGRSVMSLGREGTVGVEGHVDVSDEAALKRACSLPLQLQTTN